MNDSTAGVTAWQHDIEQEADAFRCLHPELLKTMSGEFVAIYQRQLIDHDVDQLVLFHRIEAAYPGQPVLIRRVRPEVEQTIMVRSPRVVVKSQ